MSDNHIEMEGTIIDSAKGIFKVKIDETESIVICSIAGKLRKNKINLLVGDRVRVKISPYDLSRGIVAYRLRT